MCLDPNVMAGLSVEVGTIRGRAIYSRCNNYRYLLERTWDPDAPAGVFVMLNPSVATAVTDDKTVAKCLRFVSGWGCGRLTVLNLFAWISPDPVDLFVEGRDAEGPHNRVMLERKILDCGADARIICAWGNPAGRTGALTSFLQAAIRNRWPLEALRLTNNGQPAHPLYLPENLQPIRFDPAPLAGGGSLRQQQR